MLQDTRAALVALNQRYFTDFPLEAAQELERLAPAEIAEALAQQQPHVAVRVWQYLAPDVAHAVLDELDEPVAAHLLAEAPPAVSALLLAHDPAERREQRLAALDPRVAAELRVLLDYPEDSAGRLMDPVITPVRAEASIADALGRLRSFKRRGLRQLFVVDAQGKPAGRVEIQDLAVAEPPQRPLREIMLPLQAVAGDLDPREDVVAILERSPISELPVINAEGRLVGIIRQAALFAAIEQETSVDIQTMVGASRDERALSSAGFAVRKRLPWLQINLMTAFLASAVVGVFESTIASVTALAVLLPVVAGQSGNAGAQALAVTMRGLVLREIGLRQWPHLVWKEAGAGLINGLAVAATTAIGVWLWSRSVGLILVISSAMVVSMVVAGVAGALVPVALRRFGLDPATASSIVLTTITDVTGFFSFLGIATLMSGMLR